MNYKEAYEKALKSASLNRLSSNRLDLSEGDEIVGKYVARVLIKSTQKNYPDSYRYTFELDEGPADIFFSNKFDTTVGEDLHEGHIYHIKYDEKVSLADNKTFKKYTVEEILIQANPEEDNQS